MYATRSRLWQHHSAIRSGVRRRMKENPNKFAAIAFVVAGCFWWRMREKNSSSCTESAIRMKQKPKLWREHVFRWWWCRSVSTDSGKCGATTATTKGDDDDDTTQTCKKIAPRSTLTCRLLNSRDAHSLQFEHNTLHTQTYTWGIVPWFLTDYRHYF